MVIEKPCKKCGLSKALEKFPKCGEARDGRAGRCNSCGHAARSEASKRAANLRVRRWKKENPDEWRVSKREQKRRQARRLGVKPIAEVKAQATAERLARQDAMRRQREQRRQEEINRKPWKAPGLTPAQRVAIRYKMDPTFNLAARVKASIKRQSLKHQIAGLARGALVRGGSSRVIEAFIGYSIQDLRTHMERQFKDGMNWQAFAEGRIHIDHIVPMSAFNLSSVEEQRAAWQLSNLRPLWARDNRSKSDKRLFLL